MSFSVHHFQAVTTHRFINRFITAA